MTLAIFDLDNTLLDGDSDYRWGEFLCEIGLADAKEFKKLNDIFYAEYLSGTLDVYSYLRFALHPIAGKTTIEVDCMQRRFVRDYIEPILLDSAFDLIDQHRIAGDILLLITATNSVVAKPLAARLGFEHWLASEAEISANKFTGEPFGLPCFQAGKVHHLHAWRSSQLNPPDLEESWFYSDSHNDLPLMQEVGYPVAVDPDPILRAHAKASNWKVISLRS